MSTYQSNNTLVCHHVSKYVNMSIHCYVNLILCAYVSPISAHFLDDTMHTVEAVNLQQKIRRCPHVPAVQGHSARIQVVKDFIAATGKQQHDDDVKTWKSRLRASDAACNGWVRGRAAPLSHMVCLGPAIVVTCSDSLDGALLHMRDI